MLAIQLMTAVGRPPKPGLRLALLEALRDVSDLTGDRTGLHQQQLAEWLEEPYTTVRTTLLRLEGEKLVERRDGSYGYTITTEGRTQLSVERRKRG